MVQSHSIQQRSIYQCAGSTGRLSPGVLDLEAVERGVDATELAGLGTVAGGLDVPSVGAATVAATGFFWSGGDLESEVAEDGCIFPQTW